MGYFVSIFN